MAVTIKSAREIELMKEAGKILAEGHDRLGEFIQPGMSTLDIDREGERIIRSLNTIPSFLNYNGYPASICVSVNDEVVHGIGSDRILKEGDIVTLDICTLYKGFHSDSAWTYPVGQISKEKERLLHHTEKMLYIGLKEVKNGAHLNNIGARISEYAHKQNLGVVRELCGHGVGRELHEEPDVLNYGKYNTGMKLLTGMVIAVEPMITAGSRHICLLDDDWTIVTKDGRDSAHFEHTVAVTEDGYEILTGE